MFSIHVYYLRAVRKIFETKPAGMGVLGIFVFVTLEPPAK